MALAPRRNSRDGIAERTSWNSSGYVLSKAKCRGNEQQHRVSNRTGNGNRPTRARRVHKLFILRRSPGKQITAARATTHTSADPSGVAPAEATVPRSLDVTQHIGFAMHNQKREAELWHVCGAPMRWHSAARCPSRQCVRARQKFGPTPNVPPTFVNLQKRVHDLLAPHEFHTTLVDQGVTAVVLDYSRVAAHAFFTKSR